MTAYEKRLEIRWSDLDPHFHLRHSVYYDYGAYCRLSFLNENGITPEVMLHNNFGPVVFREECVFKKEIKFGDELMINLKLDKSFADMSRWTMKNELWKNGDTLAAIITVDGAWMDTNIRRLTNPSGIIKEAYENIPRTEGFQIVQST